MTRIIAGQAKGRTLKVPRQGTRPTSDRVREAVFSLLEARLGGLKNMVVLDLFAGSGALGLEAVSRGASRAVLVDFDKRAEAAARANALVVAGGGARVTVLRAKAAVLAAKRWPGEPFNLVFLDPPYSLPDKELNQLLADLDSGNLLSDGASVVVERSCRADAPTWPDDWELMDQRVYGDTVVYVARIAER